MDRAKLVLLVPVYSIGAAAGVVFAAGRRAFEWAVHRTDMLGDRLDLPM